jgi:hypothetical protein
MTVNTLTIHNGYLVESLQVYFLHVITLTDAMCGRE